MDTNEPIVDENEAEMQRWCETTREELKKDLNDWMLNLPSSGYKLGVEMAKGFIETLDAEFNKSDLLGSLVDHLLPNPAQSPPQKTPLPVTTLQAFDKLNVKTLYPYLVDKKSWTISRKKKMSVTDLKLTMRPANCLKNVCVTTVGELIQMTQTQLLRQPNFGEASIKEIKTKLTCLGLSFRRYGE